MTNLGTGLWEYDRHPHISPRMQRPAIRSKVISLNPTIGEKLRNRMRSISLFGRCTPSVSGESEDGAARRDGDLPKCPTGVLKPER